VPGIECEDTPSIVTAGYMPLLSSHHDDGDGYAVRVNRPRPPDGRYSTPQSSPGEAPYARTLNLHGCHRIGDPTHYRLTYEFEGASAVPFTGLAWWAPRLGPGAPIHMVPDADGWYPVLPASDLAHPNWLLSWPTNAFGNGTYDVRLELGNLSSGTISVADQSAPRRFEIDNTRPDVQLLEIRWRSATVPLSTPWNDVTSELLTGSCLVLERPIGEAVHLRVIWSAAATHLRNAQLRGGGCGGGLSFLTGEDTRQRWHVGPSDNSVMRTAVMMLPDSTSHPAGCYSVRVDAWGRQFNPSGFDHGPSANWFINQGAFSWSRVSRAISVVDV
jgi:hypothetical protein